MDQLLPLFTSFPPHPPPAQPLTDTQYDENVRSHLDSLKALPAKELLEDTPSGENLLDVIDPNINSIAYLHILLAHIGAMQTQISTSISNDMLWHKILTFLETFDPRQIRYVGSELNELVTVVAGFARQFRQPSLAVPVISNTILRVDPSGSTLTSMHLLLAKLTVECQSYTHPVPALDQHIMCFPVSEPSIKPNLLCSRSLLSHEFITPNSGLTKKLKYQDILEYFLFTGNIYAGMQMWRKALERLEVAVSYPAKDNTVSKIMVEAYKKWTIVNLLLTGTVAGLPSTTSGNTAKLFHSIAKPYDVVAALFESASATRLKAEVDVGQEIWKNDGNSFLMHCALAAHQGFQIRNLAKVYSTISISKLTQMTTSAETGECLPSDRAMEDLLADMIARGVLHASVITSTDSSSILSFRSNGTALSGPELKLRLAASLKHVKSLMNDVEYTDGQLAHDKEYLKWAFKQKKLGDTNLADGYTAEVVNWNVGPDEDLMSN